MPRMAGVSIPSTVSLRNFRPRPCTTAACFFPKPIVLFTSFTLIRLASADFFAARFAIIFFFVNLRGSSWILVDRRGSSWIFVDLRGSSWIFVLRRSHHLGQVLAAEPCHHRR